MLMPHEGARWTIHPFSMTLVMGAGTFDWDDHLDIAPDPDSHLTERDRAGVERGAAAILASAFLIAVHGPCGSMVDTRCTHPPLAPA